MKRSARQQAESASSLFPFLAVLLCTMGALIVLLVTLAQVSRNKAVAKAEAAVAAEPPVPQEVEETEARIAALDERLDEAAEWSRRADERLAEEKARLADVNHHIRKIQEEAEELVAEMQELLLQEEQHFDDEKMAQEELARLQEQAELLEEEIEQLEDATTTRQRVALIPPRIDGAGTRRPPIYFECFGDKVVLQPEGIDFPLVDTRGAEHSSPFAAAVGAVVQYYLEYPSAFAEGEAGDPYPLIVTKPEGVSAMLMVKRAFDATGITYGYETVPSDWELDFGTRNPELAKRILQAIDVARQERAALAAYAPQLFKMPRSQPIFDDQLASGADSMSISIPIPSGGGGEGEGEGGGQGSDSESPTGALAATQPPTMPDAPIGSGGPASEGNLTPTGGDQPPTMIRIENLQDTQAAAERLKSGGGGAGPRRRGLALVRPIRLELYNDYALILPEEDDDFGAQPTRIECPDGVLNHADTILAALADHTETWGSAGEGMRWSPQVHVAPTREGASLERPVLHLLRMFGVSAKRVERVANEPALQR